MLETLIANIIQKGSSSALVLAFTGVTLATSGVAGAKLYNEMKATSEPESIELQTEAEVLGTTIEETTSTNTTGTNSQQTAGTTNTNSGTNNTFPTASPAATPNPTPGTTATNTTTGGCIIQLFGKNYDVAPLRSTHSGGDVFVCGTDMTAKYQSKHGSNVSRMAQYATTAPLTSSDPAQTNTGGSQSGSTVTSFEHEEERENEEYHEEAERHYEHEEEDDDENEDHEEHHEDSENHHESDED